MFVLYISKISLVQYIQYKNIQIECGEPFYKKVDVIFILQHFDWVLCIIRNVIWWIIFRVLTS